MLGRLQKLLIIPAIAIVGFFSLSFLTPVRVSAQSLVCEVFPFIENIGLFGIGTNLCTPGGNVSNTGTQVATSTANVLQLLLSLVFVGIIIVAVYIIIKAAIKYIRSEGDETKVKEAQKAIKTVFVGVAALFVGILGIVLILAFFQVSGGTEDLSGANTGTFLDTFFQNLFGGE